MWPGFKSLHRRHLWVGFVVGSLPSSERLYYAYFGFPVSSRPNSNSIRNACTCLNKFLRTPQCGAYYKFWALGGALIRSGALIWSWALIRAFTLVCYNFISKFKISTNPGLSQSIFDQPSPSGWDGVQDQYGIIVLITLSCNPSAVVRSGKLLSSIKYNISVYSKLWQAKERLLAVSLSSVILGTWRKFIVTSSIHMKNMVLFVLLSSVHFVKRTNIVFHLMWWKMLRTSPARVRIGNTNSVLVSKLTLQSYYFTSSTR